MCICVIIDYFKTIHENVSKALFFTFSFAQCWNHSIDGLGGYDHSRHIAYVRVFYFYFCLVFVASQGKKCKANKMNYNTFCFWSIASRNIIIIIVVGLVVVVDFTRPLSGSSEWLFWCIEQHWIVSLFFVGIAFYVLSFSFVPGRSKKNTHNNSKIAYMTNKMYKYPIRINIKPSKNKTKAKIITLLCRSGLTVAHMAKPLSFIPFPDYIQ